MLEMDQTEYLDSSVEDGELIAVLSFYDHLPIMEAIALKDVVLYGGHPRSHSPNVGIRDYLEQLPCDSSGDFKDSGHTTQKAGS